METNKMTWDEMAIYEMTCPEFLCGDDEEKEGDNSLFNTILDIGFFILVIAFLIGLISLSFFLNWVNLGQYYIGLDYLKFTLPLTCLASAIIWFIKEGIVINRQLEEMEYTEND